MKDVINGLVGNLIFNAAANLILIFLEGLSVNTWYLNVFWLPMNTVSHALHLACKNDLKCIKNVLKIGYRSTKVEEHSTKKIQKVPYLFAIFRYWT